MSISSGWAAPGSLYLHVPFCPYKCAYCDFVTHVGSSGLIEPYVSALRLEIEHIAPANPAPLDTIYFGGGTPSMLLPEQVEDILRTVEQSFGIASGAEISIEANPGTIDEAKLVGFLEAGINRISIGVQSMRAQELEALGRGHSTTQSIEAVEDARAAGFTNLNLDLIYGSTGQTLESWQSTIETVLDLKPDHLSLYSLIVEPKTRFWRAEQAGELSLPADDDVVDMYHLACRSLSAAGFEHYEVANWAMPGLQARHNRAYWLDEEFYAAGVGAYDYLRPYRSFHVRSTKRYIDHINRGLSAIAGRDKVGEEDEQFETAVMRLRLLHEGLDAQIFESRFGRSIDEIYGPVIEEIESLGFVERRDGVIRLREEMVPLANEAWRRFLPDSAAA